MSRKKERSVDELAELRRGSLSSDHKALLLEAANTGKLSDEATAEVLELVSGFIREEPNRLSVWKLFSKMSKEYQPKIESILREIDSLSLQVQMDKKAAHSIPLKEQREYFVPIIESCGQHLLDARVSLSFMLKETLPISAEVKRSGRPPIPPAVEELADQLLRVMENDGKTISAHNNNIARWFLEAVFDFLWGLDPAADRYQKPYSVENLIRRYLKSNKT